LTAILFLAKADFGDSQTFLVEQASDLRINGWLAGLYIILRAEGLFFSGIKTEVVFSNFDR
jgi:hypothetical protein